MAHWTMLTMRSIFHCSIVPGIFPIYHLRHNNPAIKAELRGEKAVACQSFHCSALRR
jgi:hypothetical protein